MATESAPLPNGRLPIMVASHERSGTHFTMNALAACFGYVSRPWIDVDRHQFNINYYHAPSLKKLFLELATLRSANLVKSHHEFEFFKSFIAATEGVINIVYVYRNPADVMSSFWRFLHTWQWAEGPAVDSVGEFAAAPPMGQLMRYQFRERGTMLDRWASHVDQWVAGARRANNIHVVRYEDLADNYDETMKRLGRRLGMQPSCIVSPARNVNVVQGGPLVWAPPAGNDNRHAVTELALARFPELMDRLGYGPAAFAAGYSAGR